MGSVNEEVVFKSNNRCFTAGVITLGGLSIPAKQLFALSLKKTREKLGGQIFFSSNFFFSFRFRKRNIDLQANVRNHPAFKKLLKSYKQKRLRFGRQW